MIEIKPRYFALAFLTLGLLAGMLLATAVPIVEHWPELETRLEAING